MNSRRLKDVLDTVSNVLFILVAVVFLFSAYRYLVTKPSMSQSGRSGVQNVNGTIARSDLTNQVGTGQIAIVEFTDFQCPFCAKHAKESLPTLKSKLIDPGKITYITVNFPLDMHPFAMRAAQVAECAAKHGKYWEMHDLLFQRQAEFEHADFTEFARQLGLNPVDFKTCLDTNASLSKVKSDQELAKRLGVNSTPTLFIGHLRKDGGIDLQKRVDGAVPAQLFVDEISKLKG